MTFFNLLLAHPAQDVLCAGVPTRQTEIDKFNNLWFNENEMIQALLPFFSVYTYIIVRKGQRRFMI